MPQVTVYIRDEDIERWREVEKKSEFIHSALRDSPSSYTLENRQVIKTPADVKKVIKKSSDKDTCSHGFSRSLRMCKYGCK